MQKMTDKRRLDRRWTDRITAEMVGFFAAVWFGLGALVGGYFF